MLTRARGASRRPCRVLHITSYIELCHFAVWQLRLRLCMERMWVNKWWYIYTMEYCSGIRGNKLPCWLPQQQPWVSRTLLWTGDAGHETGKTEWFCWHDAILEQSEGICCVSTEPHWQFGPGRGGRGVDGVQRRKKKLPGEILCVWNGGIGYVDEHVR